MTIATVGLRTIGFGEITGDSTPSLSWRIESTVRDVSQDGCHIQIAGDETFGELIFDSGEFASAESLHVPWPTRPLGSRDVVWWRVRSRTNHGWTGWSRAARIEAALLEAGDWQARFIASDEGDEDEPESGPAPMFRKTFDVLGAVRSARLYVTALGLFEVEINGERVGEDVLAPDWTAYKHRVPYYTYDVGALINEGPNAIAAVLGNGWYRGRLGFAHPVPRCIYGKRRALLAQLEIVTEDGQRTVVCSDRSWTTAKSAVWRDDLYNGTEIDLRDEQPGWSAADFAGDWDPAEELDGAEVPALFATDAPPVRAVDVRPATRMWRGPRGTAMIDLGQNGVGWLRLHMRGGESGDTVVVRHAEVLADDGSLFTKALRAARATDTYVLDGRARVVLEPKFTFHGFRFAEIDAPPAVEVDRVEAIIVHSDMERIGSFECSDLHVNRLFENIVWSQKGNFVSIPTDCPQRSERMGWTGDAQVFADTGAFIYDCRDFLGRWLDDLALDQLEDGAVPNVVPNPFDPLFPGCGGWGDAATVVPWSLYAAYGDESRLRNSYSSMKGWVDFCASKTNEDGIRVPSREAKDFSERSIMRHGIEFGDWCDPSAGGSALDASTDRYFMASAYLAYSAALVAKTADLLGEAEDASLYRALSRRVASATWAEWADHCVQTQTGCATALAFEIAPEDQREDVAKALAELVEAQGYRIGTGFLGTPLVLGVLTRYGYDAHARAMLLQRECPSWLHQVLQGATTIWERWDAIGPHGAIRTGGDAPGDVSEMLSFNHYAFGAVGAWLVRDLAGLAPDENGPGYRHVRIAPHPGDGITWARASHLGPYGPVMVHWRDSSAAFRLDVSIPPCTTATVTLPRNVGTVTMNGEPHDVDVDRRLKLASGSYAIYADRLRVQRP